jgi:hypothetical protein
VLAEKSLPAFKIKARSVISTLPNTGQKKWCEPRIKPPITAWDTLQTITEVRNSA